ncbi:MAG: response regulator [Planctomycetota bacterium]
MSRPWPVVYAGHDSTCFDRLSSNLPSFSWQHLEVSELTPENILREWRRVLILDIDVSCREGFQLFRDIRNVHGGIPIILLADLEGLRIVKMSLACLNGAEALYFKPLEELARLKESLSRGMQRIGHWHEMINLGRSTKRRVKEHRPQAVAKAVP